MKITEALCLKEFVEYWLFYKYIWNHSYWMFWLGTALI